MRRTISYLSCLALFFVILLLESCSKKSSPVQPNPPNTVKAKGVWILEPDASTLIWYVGREEAVQWKLNPDSTIKKIVVEYQQDSSAWTYFFDAQADSLTRKMQIAFDLSHKVRFRIRNVLGGEWDTSSFVTIRDGMKIIFPQAGMTFYDGMTIYIKHTCPYGIPFAVEYRDASMQPSWHRVTNPTKDPNWTIPKDFGSQSNCVIRLIDSTGTIIIQSDAFNITNISNSDFKLIFPFGGERFITGDILKIQFVSKFTPYAFDISTNAGQSWNEIVPPFALPEWKVNISQPSTKCRVRMRCTDPTYPFAFESNNFEIDTVLVKFRITYPQGGDQIRAGDYIFPLYISNVGDSLIFSLSNDDGVTWTANYQIPVQFGLQNYGFFINQGPSDKCRMKMQTWNGKYSTISERFSIPNDLADFFSIDVGKEWKYRYTYDYGSTLPPTFKKEVKIVTLHVDSKTQDQNYIYYNSTVLNTDTNGVILSTNSAVVREGKTGLHSIDQIAEPFNFIPYRYFSSTFETIPIGRFENHAEKKSKGGTIQKGIGLTGYSILEKLDAYSSRDYIWELIQ